MRELFFDCGRGISGDMTLGALVDLGVPFDELKAALRTLPLTGYRISAAPAGGCGISGTKISVSLLPTHPDNRRERYFPELLAMIEAAQLPDPVAEKAARLLRIQAEANAAAHRISLAEVCFHERGAVDTMVDLVGASFCLYRLAPDRILSTPLTDGTGSILCRRGRLPVPVPAVREITGRFSIPTRSCAACGELVTPTGASIAAGCFDGFQETLPPGPARRGAGFGARNREQGGFLLCYLHEHRE